MPKIKNRPEKDGFLGFIIKKLSLGTGNHIIIWYQNKSQPGLAGTYLGIRSHIIFHRVHSYEMRREAGKGERNLADIVKREIIYTFKGYKRFHK